MIRTIKKYSNRKYYDVTTSRYITLDNITLFILEGMPFKVLEMPFKRDITKQVVAQVAGIEIERHYKAAEHEGYALELIQVLFNKKVEVKRV